MDVSRRDLLKQLPTKDSLRALGQLAGSLGLGAFVKTNGGVLDAIERTCTSLGRHTDPQPADAAPTANTTGGEQPPAGGEIPPTYDPSVDPYATSQDNPPTD